MHRAVVDVPCRRDEAGPVLGALAVEADDAPPGVRVGLHWSEDPPGLRIEVESHDLAGLRAALQGTMRLVDASLRVVDGTR